MQERTLAHPSGRGSGRPHHRFAAADLLVYTDKNGDGKIEEGVEHARCFSTGFAASSTITASIASPRVRTGSGISTRGKHGGAVHDRSGKTFYMGSPYQLQDIAGSRSDDGHVWIGGFSVRMNPDGSNATILGTIIATVRAGGDSFGDLFQSDNDDPPALPRSHVLEGGNAGFASADGQRALVRTSVPDRTRRLRSGGWRIPARWPAGDVYGGGSRRESPSMKTAPSRRSGTGMLLACEGREKTWSSDILRSATGRDSNWSVSTS